MDWRNDDIVQGLGLDITTYMEEEEGGVQVVSGQVLGDEPTIFLHCCRNEADGRVTKHIDKRNGHIVHCRKLKLLMNITVILMIDTVSIT